MTAAEAADGRDHRDQPLRTITLCALYRRTPRLCCRACPYVRLLDAVPLWWLFARRGWNDRLPEARSRFYCSQCWRRSLTKVAAPRIMIVREAATGPQFDYPPEREWKKLVARYRA